MPLAVDPRGAGTRRSPAARRVLCGWMVAPCGRLGGPGALDWRTAVRRAHDRARGDHGSGRAPDRAVDAGSSADLVLAAAPANRHRQRDALEGIRACLARPWRAWSGASHCSVRYQPYPLANARRMVRFFADSARLCSSGLREHNMPSPSFANRLLRLLGPAASEKLLPMLTKLPLKLRAVIESRGRTGQACLFSRKRRRLGGSAGRRQGRRGWLGWP
jgi:hypothetical protein